MSGEDPEYTVQKFRDGFAIVWWDIEGNGESKRRRIRLEAKDRASAASEARKKWEGGDSSPWTVGRCMTVYMATVAEKPSYTRRQDAWKAMKPFWENVDPKMIDEQMCKDYRKSRPSVGDTTARYELQQLSTALGACKKHIGEKPDLWFPALPERKIRHLTRTEFASFFDAVKADHAQLYVMVGLHTVARPSTILQLTWDRVDFMRRLIDFTPAGHIRTNKRRTVVPISDDLLPWLQKGYVARTTNHVIERGGKAVACIKKAFQAASERSTVHATPYTLRHTGAVWAAEGGVSMSELAQFMGHDDDRTTQKHYARYSPDYLKSVANAIGGRARGSM